MCDTANMCIIYLITGNKNKVLINFHGSIQSLFFHVYDEKRGQFWKLILSIIETEEDKTEKERQTARERQRKMKALFYQLELSVESFCVHDLFFILLMF